MTTLHIEHEITDYDTWRSAFSRLAEARHHGGVAAERVMRPIDDPAYVFIELDFATTQAATAFLRFLEGQVWSSADNAPALVGQPRTTILEPAPAPS